MHGVRQIARQADLGLRTSAKRSPTLRTTCDLLGGTITAVNLVVMRRRRSLVASRISVMHDGAGHRKVPGPLSFNARKTRRSIHPRLPHDCPHPTDTHPFRPRIHTRLIRRQTSFGSPLPQALDLVAPRCDSHGYDVLRGLNERGIWQRCLSSGAGRHGVESAASHQPSAFTHRSLLCTPVACRSGSRSIISLL